MRIMAYALVGLGLLLLVCAAYDEHRGVTSIPVLTGGVRAAVVLDGGELTRAASPVNFKNAMKFHWFYAFVTLSSGVILLLIIRGQDKIDPFSPDFDWKDEDDAQTGTKQPKNDFRGEAKIGCGGLFGQKWKHWIQVKSNKLITVKHL